MIKSIKRVFLFFIVISFCIFYIFILLFVIWALLDPIWESAIAVGIMLVLFLIIKLFGNIDSIVKTLRKYPKRVHIAIKAGNYRYISHYIDKCKDIEAANYYGETLLYLAIEANNAEIMELLIDSGADVNKFSSHYEDFLTPLHLLARLKLADRIWELGVSNPLVNIVNQSGQSPLHYAAQYGRVEYAKFLSIWHGSVIDLSDINGCTPLHYAVENNSYEVAQLLISRGANINEIDHSNENSVIKAVRKNYYEIAKLLLEKGAECEVIIIRKSKDEMTPEVVNSAYKVASENNNPEILELLKSHTKKRHLNKC